MGLTQPHSFNEAVIDRSRKAYYPKALCGGEIGLRLREVTWLWPCDGFFVQDRIPQVVKYQRVRSYRATAGFLVPCRHSRSFF